MTWCYIHLKRYFLFFFSGFHWVLLDGFLCHRSKPTSCWKELATNVFFIVFGGFHGYGRTKCFFMALESVLLPGERNSLAPILVPTLPPRSQHLASNPILINNPNHSTSIQINPILTNNPNRPKSLNNYAPLILRLTSLTHVVNYYEKVTNCPCEYFYPLVFWVLGLLFSH